MNGEKMLKKFFVIIIVFVLTFTTFAEDLSDKWWGTTVPSAFMIYIVNPQKLAGWPAKLYSYEAAYLPDEYKKLPILGSWHEGGGLPDKEMLLKHNIKNAFLITSAVHREEKYTELKKLRMKEVFTIKGENLRDNIALLRELGKKLGVPERGEALAEYGENALAQAASMTKDIKRRPKVYIAERSDGLTTSCTSEILSLAGGENAFTCDKSITKGFTKVSFEQILALDPDVVIVTNPFFAETVKSDPKWQRLRAYKENNLFIVPYGPFGWLDKPAVMRFIALKWLACKLHSDKCEIEMETETKEFMKLFLHLELTDDEVKTILYR